MARRGAAFVVLAAIIAATVSVPTMLHRSDAVAGTSWPVKIFSVGTPTKQFDAVLSNPYVAGISVRFGWKGIQPKRGTYRWGQIDDAIRKARAAGKKVMIRVMAGAWTPDWVNRNVRTLSFSSRYLYGGSMSSVTMPIPWKRHYLRPWRRFIRHMGHRYDGNPTVYSIQMAGGGFLGEMCLPTDVDRWKAVGYRDARLIRAWKRIVIQYRRSFPHTHLNLDIDEPFGNLLDTNVVHPVVRFATRDGIRKAWIQQNGLRASLLGVIGPYRKVIRAESRETRVGYQMQRATGTATELKTAFTVALQDHANYLEVYASDVLDGANQAALRYLATGGTS
jgi:Beta-galactosidase